MKRWLLSGDGGFTLLETLIAVLLMGVIMAALATVTAQWMPGWDRGIGLLQRTDNLALALDRLASDIAVAEIISPGAGNTPPMFDGNENSMVFVRTALSPNAEGGLEFVRLGETSDERGPVLVRRTSPFVPNTDNADSILYTSAVEMIRAPFRVTFSYAGPDRVWRENWHQQPVLPRAVRLTVRDMATSAVLTVSTATLIHAELSASCTWADTTIRCPEFPGLQAAMNQGLNGQPNGASGTNGNRPPGTPPGIPGTQ
jgi:general secretion pathway protein J